MKVQALSAVVQPTSEVTLTIPKTHPKVLSPHLRVEEISEFNGFKDWQLAHHSWMSIYIIEKQRDTSSMSTRSSVRCNLLRVFLTKLVLEVLGGGGAIWGPSDVFTLRNPDTREFWRNKALLVASTLAARLFLHLIDVMAPYERDEKTILRLGQTFLAKFVLEVLGSIGAIWGVAECLTLRNTQNKDYWRISALAVGAIFFVRFLFEIGHCVKEMNGKIVSTPMPLNPMSQFYQRFAAKLVLDVFGSGEFPILGIFGTFSVTCTHRNFVMLAAL